MANQIIVNVKTEKNTIDRNIYGHFAEHLGRCIYDGFYVGENSTIPNVKGFRLDVIEALKKINLPVLRWPGGCFADEYHWRDGVGPREERPIRVNTHWGGVQETNEMGTHEFMDLCELLECEPYICGNVGSGTPQEMSEWVEYMTFDGDSPRTRERRKNGKEEPWKLKYFGIGNENWNCGGRMTAEHYADVANRFNLYCRNYGDNKLYRIVVGPRSRNYHWTEVVMREMGLYVDAISLHHYTRIGDPGIVIKRPDGNERYVLGPPVSRGSAVDFREDEWFSVMEASYEMDEILRKHCAIMDRYDPEKRVGLAVDEWGTWFECEPGTIPAFLFQQNTLRDALSAAINLTAFNKHSDRVRMANIAQIINVLQALIFTEGPKMVLTPTYHVFDMFKVHQDSKLLESAAVCDKYFYGDKCIDQICSTISKDEEGILHMTICNVDPNREAEVECYAGDAAGLEFLSSKILTAPEINAMNTFDEPNTVHPVSFEGVSISGNKMSVKMPPKSIVEIDAAILNN